MEPKTVTNEEFFKYILGELDGYFRLFIVDRSAGKVTKQKFYKYPDDLHHILDFVESNKVKWDLYFSPFLYTKRKAKKENIAEVTVAWADGDTCPLDSLLVPPTVVVRTSTDPIKYHYYWKFDQIETPDIGEVISKRIAYHHADEGMDKTGWDLTQLLRIPNTYNHKHTPAQPVSPAVVLPDLIYSSEVDFEEYPQVEDAPEVKLFKDITLPDKSAKQILEEYEDNLSPIVFDLFQVPPVEDWSAALWSLEMSLIESGMPLEEAFIVARDSACNKYARDKRPQAFLWKEVCRASSFVDKKKEAPPEVEHPTFRFDDLRLLKDIDRGIVDSDETFVERFTNWASALSDAAPQYHPAGAFIILSSLLSGSIKLPTQFGTIIPNLWFMILADTTLTRKSTAMDIATDLLLEVDEDILLATDGSLEGMLTALSLRSGKPSLFLRDEVTGLIESLTKREYLAGMMEMLTKLYDGKTMKRILRRETIVVKDPRLVMFSGGIRSKMLELLDYKHVSSGFLPRFVFVTAESDITKLRPIGPPTMENMQERDDFISYLTEMKDKYVEASVSTSGSSVHFPKKWLVELTPSAWRLYNELEIKMLKFAQNSHDPTLVTPMMDRLAKSGLKATMLIATSRMPDDKILATEQDVIHAFYYIEQWSKHTIYIMRNLGTSGDERKVQKVLSYVVANPGALRSKVMQHLYLSKRDADQIFGTLEARDAITRKNRGARGERIFPVA